VIVVESLSITYSGRSIFRHRPVTGITLVTDLIMPGGSPPSLFSRNRGELMGDTKPDVCNLHAYDETGKLRDFSKNL
jgi:hypothetical protein